MWQPCRVHHLMTVVLAQDADLLVEQWPSTLVEGLVQGAVYALLALACTRARGRVDVGQVAGFSLGLFAAYSAFWALGFRPGPTPRVAPALVLVFLVVGLFAAVAAASAAAIAMSRARSLLSGPRWALPLGVGAFAVVHLGIWLLRGAQSEPMIRPFRPHELLPDVDDLQLAILVLAAAAIVGAAAATRRGEPPLLVSGGLAGMAAFLYLLKVPSSAWYLTGISVGLYAVTAVVLGRTARGVVVAAVALGVVQVAVETVLGSRWWLPFAGALLVAATGLRLLLAWRRRRAGATA